MEPKPVKFVWSAIFVSNDLEAPVLRILEETIGDMDFVGERIPFDKTRYYEKEMGTSLHRRMLSFRKLAPPEDLVEAKIRAQSIEERYRNDLGNRSVNLDPGILSMHNFVLATHKCFTHRIYLGKGVYGDLTLLYQKRDFHKLQWTYPDYSSSPIMDILKQIRTLYMWQLKNLEGVAESCFKA